MSGEGLRVTWRTSSPDATSQKRTFPTHTNGVTQRLSILLPNNQRQHRTLHASRKMCCPTHCANNCAPCQPLLRAFSEWIRSPTHTGSAPPRRSSLTQINIVQSQFPQIPLKTVNLRGDVFEIKTPFNHTTMTKTVLL